MSKTIRDLAHEAGISDEDFDRLDGMMDYIGKVVAGKVEKPDGPGCVFPHCQCNKPFEKCEKAR